MLAFSIVAAVVLANAYLRARAIFELAWQNNNISGFSEIWQLVLAQPAIYINETFGNLGRIAESMHSAPAIDRAYLLNDISDHLRMYPDDVFAELRSKGKMTTFLGSALANGGYLLSGCGRSWSGRSSGARTPSGVTRWGWRSLRMSEPTIPFCGRRTSGRRKPSTTTWSCSRSCTWCRS